MKSIDGVISELVGIRNALDQGTGEPRRRPRLRGSTAAPASERVSGNPIFDSGRWEIADQSLWDEEKENARRAVEGEALSSGWTGIEALAWYVSFHDNQHAWGIYIPLSSLALMDELYLGGLPMERDRRLHLAWSVFLHHEQMHFAVDHACAWFELMLRAPIRREFMARFKANPPLQALTTSEAYLEIEETAANAHMLRQLGQTASRQIVRMIEEFVEKQPVGYREGLEATGDGAFADAMAETLRSYFALWAIEHRLDLGNREMNLSRLLPLEDNEVLAECPVYVLDDLEDVGVAPGSVRLIQCIAEIVETESFERQLQRQDPAVRRDWSRKKEQIKICLPSPPRLRSELRGRRAQQGFPTGDGGGIDRWNVHRWPLAGSGAERRAVAAACRHSADLGLQNMAAQIASDAAFPLTNRWVMAEACWYIRWYLWECQTENRNLDIKGVDILLVVVLVDLDHQFGLGLGAFAHALRSSSTPSA